MSASRQGYRVLHGIEVPFFLYGTAWKEERTEALTRLALDAGFVGIDTANQRKHYFEAAVGAALTGGKRARGELFLQTKFTYRGGQDQRLPYDPAAPLEQQVAQSFESSLTHLGTDVIDSYLLHGPSSRSGITRDDWEVWRAMERLHASGRVKYLGVSNVSLSQLRALVDGAIVKPVFVQNRCYAADGWDRGVRAFCRDSGIIYQGFSLLTANRRELETPVVRRIAERTGRSVAQIVFRFALELGMLPLTGTSSEEHMRLDLAAPELSLLPGEVAALERLAG
jgi:diketogulonate reductase-like aldo/keto reductase